LQAHPPQRPPAPLLPIATGAKKGDKGPWALMVLDGCGVPIKMSVEASNAEMRAIQDEIAADEIAKVQKKKDADAKSAAEQAALLKQYLNFAQTQGFDFVKGKNNTNVFELPNIFQILGQREVAVS